MTPLYLHTILSARLLIILHMARYSQTFIFSLFSYLSKVNIIQDYSDWNKKKRNNRMYLSIFMSSLIAWLLPGEVKSD
jgi:hypothetical protein